MFQAPASAPCPFCNGPRVALTCTCRACPDTTPHCECPRGEAALLEAEGLCEGCLDAGCRETLAGFPRCRRLK
ncbi:MAG: hypothetical protein JNK72_11560 [Myxococcales bacterium]|nr:hypothetical protein [Myxococcales bacterium]